MPAPDPITYFTDIGVGRRVPAALRAAGWAVERHADHFADTAADVDWIPVAGRNGWVVITKDAAIRYNPAERTAVIEHGVRMIAFARADYRADRAAGYLLANADAIDRLVRTEPPPFIAVLSREGLRLIRLGSDADDVQSPS